MKKRILFFGFASIAIFTALQLSAQVSITTDNSAPDGNAMLDVKSSAKGILVPRMTNVQISTITSPATGLVVYCTDCNNGVGCLNVYEGGGWHCMGAMPIFVTTCGIQRVYYPVFAAGYVWLDRNMGAGRVAASSTDYQAYGELYQWGRKSDGHQCITWTSSTSGTPQNGTTTTQCTGGTCANALFVYSNADWNSTTNNLLWRLPPKGDNDPCPSGYRVPSIAELETLRLSFSTNNAAGAFGSPVKLTMPSGRNYFDGNLYGSVGSQGSYWSTTIYDANNVYQLMFASSSGSTTNWFFKATGYSVRCIAN
ncbi:MAG: hypothetical protein NTW10_06915 [Bacteroidetes bacterium]|nr:hypothetical protein [Bacteroidota bacterium]